MASPSELKVFLKAHRRASLADMAVHFGVSNDTVRALLEPWIAKRKVRRIAPANANPANASPSCGGVCGGCCCASSAAEVYAWCEPD